MKCLAISHKGCEEIVALDIKEILGRDSELLESCVRFDAEDTEEIERLAYQTGSVKRLVELIGSGKADSLDDINTSMDFGDKTFAVRCKRIGQHDFKSLDVEKRVGSQIKGRVDLQEPDCLIYVYIYEDEYYIGIDHIGFDLSKRSYHVFNHPTTIKGTMAYCLVRMSGFSKGETLVDTFSRSGGIPLEAALYAYGKSPHFYDKQRFRTDCSRFDGEEDTGSKIVGYDQQLKNVKASQKNAKVAGINKQVSFLRGDIEWLDTKFKEKEVDRVVSYPPQMSSRKNRREIQKLASELFHQLEFVLRDDGKAVLLLRHSEDYEEAAENNGFFLKEEKSVFQGQEHLFACVFEKR